MTNWEHWSGRRWKTATLAAAILAIALTGCGVLPYQPVPLIAEGPPPGYISGTIPNQYKGKQDPYSPSDLAVRAPSAPQLYATFDYSCLSCHGATGRGDGPMSTYLDFRPADFSAPPMQAAFRDHQDYVFWWVNDGITKTQMPNFRDRMTETEIWQVITYAWYLGSTPVGPSGPLGESNSHPYGSPPETKR